MAARLGHALYWIGCVSALLLAAGATWVLAETGDRRIGFILFVYAPALAVWFLGKVSRYVLSGDT